MLLSFIGGGNNNFIKSNCSDECYFRNNSIINGCSNTIDKSSFSLIGSGSGNIICGYTCKNQYNRNNTIVSGISNSIAGNSTYFNKSVQLNFIGNGDCNKIFTNGNADVLKNSIVGGYCNSISASGEEASCNFIGGGKYNVICGNTQRTNINTIIGGQSNSITDLANAHIIGCGITATASDYSFMNNLCVSGLVKSSGTFKISHPDPSKNKTHTLSHSFVESPTAGDNIYRYEVEVKDGVAIIDLPEYFKYLNENTQVWVSAKNGFGIGYGEINEDITQITIYANLDIHYNVLIVGTRKDEIAVKHWKGVERVKSQGELEADKNKLKSEENK
jgi:hypothetical protein